MAAWMGVVSVLVAGACRSERAPATRPSADAGVAARRAESDTAPGSTGLTAARVRPGDELFAVVPEVISQLEYTSPDVRWIAWRWPGATTFHVVYATREGQFRHFTGGPRLQTILKLLESVRVREASFEGAPERYGLADPSQLLSVRTEGSIDAFELPLGNYGSGSSIYVGLPSGQVVTIDDKLILLLRAGAGE